MDKQILVSKINHCQKRNNMNEFRKYYIIQKKTRHKNMHIVEFHLFEGQKQAEYNL